MTTAELLERFQVEDVSAIDPIPDGYELIDGELQEMTNMGAFIQEMAAAGVLLQTDGLQDSSKGVREAELLADQFEVPRLNQAKAAGGQPTVGHRQCALRQRQRGPARTRRGRRA